MLVIDTRRSGGLAALPDGVAADLPGLAPGAQATQLGTFGPASGGAAGGAAFDIAAGASPVFLLIGGGATVGQVEAGRLGVLGRGGSAFLVGTLGGTGGEGVAPLVAVASTGVGYLFNGCTMGAAVCAAPAPPPDVPPMVPPVVSPAEPDVPPAAGDPAGPIAGPSLPAPAPPEPASPSSPPTTPRLTTADDALNAPPQPPAPRLAWPFPWPLPPLVEQE